MEGEDPRDVERIFDCMYRATINYGRKGLPLQAISAVDLALWDLLGKIRELLTKLRMMYDKASCCRAIVKRSSATRQPSYLFVRWRACVRPAGR